MLLMAIPVFHFVPLVKSVSGAWIGGKYPVLSHDPAGGTGRDMRKRDGAGDKGGTETEGSGKRRRGKGGDGEKEKIET